MRGVEGGGGGRGEEEKEEEERRKRRRSRSKLRLVACINHSKAHLLTEANQVTHFTSLLASANTLSAFYLVAP